MEAISVFFMQQTSKLLNIALDTTHAQGVTNAVNRTMESSDHLTPSADICTYHLRQARWVSLDPPSPLDYHDYEPKWDLHLT